MNLDFLKLFDSPEVTLDDFVNFFKLDPIDSTLEISDPATSFADELMIADLVPGQNSLGIFNITFFSGGFINRNSSGDKLTYVDTLDLSQFPKFLSFSRLYLTFVIEECFRCAKNPEQLRLIKKFLKLYFQQIISKDYTFSRMPLGGAGEPWNNIFRSEEMRIVSLWVAEQISKLSKARLLKMHEVWSPPYPNKFIYHWLLSEWIGNLAQCRSEIKKTRNFDYSAQHCIAIASARLNGMNDLTLSAKIDIFGIGSK